MLSWTPAARIAFGSTCFSVGAGRDVKAGKFDNAGVSFMTFDRRTSSPDGDFSPDGSASVELIWSRCVRQAALGDQAAFAQLYDLTSPAVYGLALRMLADPAEAEEGAQGAYQMIWKFLPSIGVAKLATMAQVLAIAHTHLVTCWHRGREQWATPCEQLTGATWSPTTNRVDPALAELPVRQREALVMAYLGARTYREVAALTGVSGEAAAGRIHDGLAGLREHVSPR